MTKMTGRQLQLTKNMRSNECVWLVVNTHVQHKHVVFYHDSAYTLS